MDWEEAGRGWGARALDWAYLDEPYARPANDELFDRLGVGVGTRLLDVACGSGYAASTASRRGASVAGLDASAALIDIARARSPAADFRVGDMFALPFDDDSFDVVTSFNGIWKGCEAALSEVRRVLIDGGRFGMTFWGPRDRLGLLPFFLKIVELSPPSHQAATMEQGRTRRVVEDMLRATQFRLLDQGAVDVVMELPDVETAVRALAAAGPAVPAIESVGYESFCRELREVIAPLHDPHTGIRITSEFRWVTAQPT
ncbi:MAG TPA: methyltransferase domain-containing protein [Acidimicrobiia bacterium]